MCSTNPAKTSIKRAEGRSDSGMLSHAAMVSARGVSLLCRNPAKFLLTCEVFSRSASQPSSNWPLYLSAHSLKIWCGPWAAPGAQYMKNGLSGQRRCWLHPSIRLISQIFGKMITRIVRRLDGIEVFKESRLPLRVSPARNP